MQPLHILNLTGNNPLSVGIPSAVLRNTNHRSGRAFARNLYNHRPDIDAVLYPSRFNTALCIAVFDRAVSKIEAISKVQLDRHPETARILKLFNLQLRS